jgi:Gamma-glutamyl cyclotransferase, AIG2-like
MSTVWGFFYGGLINPEVMARVGMKPTGQEVATLPGYDIRIRPLVNLVTDPGSVVYGLLLQLTHEELHKVYSQLKATYLPQPVLAFTLDGKARPALCYVVPELADGEAEAEHVLSLLKAAEKLDFPDWYLEKIRRFLPAGAGE